MSEVRYYTVTQEREVKVAANSAIDAARIGDSELQGTPIEDTVCGHITTPVRVRDIVVREDY